MPLSPRQRHCLSRMGVDVWVLRRAAQAAAESSLAQAGVEAPVARRHSHHCQAHGDDQAGAEAATATPLVQAGAEVPVSAEAGASVETTDEVWQTLQDEVRTCRQCPLHQSRTQAVFGVGNPSAQWLLVGEAPGAEEDRRGEPFVGQAGKLLDAMLQAMGLARNQVFITNILKCRPPGNRDPQPEEVAACADYLGRQIAWLRPRIILALGRVAARQLLGVEAPIGSLRGRAHRYRLGDLDIPLAVTWHPAYLLRQPMQKARAWQDLQLAMRLAP